MPTEEWWDEATAAYKGLVQLLVADIDSGDHRNRTSRPLLSVLPTGNFLRHLSSTREPLQFVIFGNIRHDLFLEIVWQHITAAQSQELNIKAYEVSSKCISIDFRGFLFAARYLEASEIVTQ